MTGRDLLNELKKMSDEDLALEVKMYSRYSVADFDTVVDSIKKLDYKCNNLSECVLWENKEEEEIEPFLCILDEN